MKTAYDHHAAEVAAIYAGRPFSRLPRIDVHNWVHGMIRLLSS
jgi:hypothetical protein